jgi:hypothetical protein
VSAQDLRRAAEIKETIDALQNELAEILGSESVASGPHLRGGRRKMSAPAKARIAASARARWARVRKTESSQPRKRVGKKRSAAVRARLAAIAKERWRKAKAAGKTTL